MHEKRAPFNPAGGGMSEIVLFRTVAVVMGLVLGSFYNVCIHRGITGESVVDPPRSRCPKCGHDLSWWENIPLVSWAVLRGKCRSCRLPISVRYPLVEALSGGLALALAVRFGMSGAFAAYFLFFGLLIVLSFIDWETMTLPLCPMLIGAGAAFALSEPVLGVSFVDAGFAAVGGAGCFWGIRLAYRRLRGIEGMGEGDVYLMLLLGPLVGGDLLPLVVIVGGVGLMVASLFMTRGKAEERMTQPIPFGPFLCLGAVFAVLVGDSIMNWWMG